jgi:hypothetical protein
MISNKVKVDELGRECSTFKGDAKCIEGFGGESRREEDTRKT